MKLMAFGRRSMMKAEKEKKIGKTLSKSIMPRFISIGQEKYAQLGAYPLNYTLRKNT